MAAQLIVRGGGDAGGIVITPDGEIRPVPPFEPGLRLRLASLGGLLRAAEHGEERAREETARLSDTLQAHVLREAEQEVGALDERAGLIRVSDDGIDICGTPPRHIRLGEFRPGRSGIADPIAREVARTAEAS